MVRLIVTGVAGKMGSVIMRLAQADPEVAVTGCTEIPGHPMAGKNVGEGTTACPVTDELAKIIDMCDVVIDFTGPESSLQNFRTAVEHAKGIVIGTTGLKAEALKEIMSAKDAKVVISPNMSVGMNLMFDIVEKVSRILKEDYDAEIVEMHHRLKKDAPSGTAVKLMEVIKGVQPEKEWLEIYGRKGITGERKQDEIGVLALRGGDVVGEHTVMFAGIGERLEITHRAYSRDNFAKGAVLAAKWLFQKTHGAYTMRDVLGLQ
ncbi:MAG: 4-hydroxy-tetrahydrodipicolinate reductase [Syntrophobacterales bacterium]|jgi:4-hydroxy-tetrahydrodipicolinate reductase|nr:4-hydroxy-tetrahydrodipicolinate reductase [Syntrophobacterales bacterium]